MRVSGSELTALVVCPACRGTLQDQKGGLSCARCSRNFRRVRGIPVLLSEDDSIFSAEVVAAERRTRTRHRGLRAFLPSVTRNDASRQNYKRLISALAESDNSSGIVLSVGGGEGGAGSESLFTAVKVLVTDISINDRTDAVADAHHLPFPDNTFDAVIVQAVLEHVLEPAKCVAEVHRVCRVGGFVYAETPFMQQVHMGRYDFTRFTALGHRWLFRRFEQVDAGVVAGAGSAAAWALTYLTASLARSARQRSVLQALGRILFFWLKYFDALSNKNPAAWDGAAGFYFLGRKVEDFELTAAQLTGSYRGAVPS